MAADPWWFTRQLEPWSPAKLLTKPKTGADVNYVQLALGAPQTGVYDESTAQRVKGLQMAMGLRVTGVVDLDTAKAIDYIAGVESG